MSRGKKLSRHLIPRMRAASKVRLVLSKPVMMASMLLFSETGSPPVHLAAPACLFLLHKLLRQPILGMSHASPLTKKQVAEWG